MPSFKFHKKERLTNKKKIENLFSNGQVIKAFPLKLIYNLEQTKDEGEAPAQFAFTVPKRSFKQAVSRNFLKRRIKEAFRLNKHSIHSSSSIGSLCLYGMFIYIDKEVRDYQSIEKAMKKAIAKLQLEISKSNLV